MRFENSELRAFRGVIEEGGFRRAADALHISQSAVSQAVAGLEGKLGMPLIERGKELRLTDAGRRVFDHACEVLSGEQQTLEDIAQLRRGQRETLNLALSASINRFHAPALLTDFSRRYPQVRLKVAELPARNIIYTVLSGTVELGFGPFQKDMQAFRVIPLYSDSRHLVVSPSHPLFEAIMGGERDALAQTPLITSALDNPELRPSIARLRDQFSTVWEVSSLLMRIHMVFQGLGVTFMDRQVLSEHPDCAEFCVIDDVSFGTIDKQVGLYSRNDKKLSESAARFVSLCEERWNL
ncbi:LysR family transcriptional regulator [Mangrovimicrobium sediminis]|uniref:LysR family transcriptional regulator n=1 Tax=Mangrovimicrobium sediminis TaxID=2562682 RepID=A0A4Z0M8I8_9GAMM|nr:LysR family transcriptional regulator [Haliea sp. SAOS-164]TGD75839.1 LysR family transcriptional regulator [Haliea sp. SAOS-164]